MSLPANPLQWRIGLIGYGEVGRILAEDLRAQRGTHLGVVSATKMCRSA